MSLLLDFSARKSPDQLRDVVKPEGLESGFDLKDTAAWNES